MFTFEELSPAQQKALLSMRDKPVWNKPYRTFDALVNRGLATYRHPELQFTVCISEMGRILLRQYDARNQRPADFTVGEVVEMAWWMNSQSKWSVSLSRYTVSTAEAHRPMVGLRRKGFAGELFEYPNRLLKVAQPAAALPAVPVDHPALTALRLLNVDALDPIGALTKLYELKKMAG